MQRAPLVAGPFTDRARRPPMPRPFSFKSGQGERFTPGDCDRRSVKPIELEAEGQSQSGKVAHHAPPRNALRLQPPRPDRLQVFRQAVTIKLLSVCASRWGASSSLTRGRSPPGRAWRWAGWAIEPFIRGKFPRPVPFLALRKTPVTAAFIVPRNSPARPLL